MIIEHVVLIAPRLPGLSGYKVDLPLSAGDKSSISAGPNWRRCKSLLDGRLVAHALTH